MVILTKKNKYDGSNYYDLDFDTIVELLKEMVENKPKMVSMAEEMKLESFSNDETFLDTFNIFQEDLSCSQPGLLTTYGPGKTKEMWDQLYRLINGYIRIKSEQTGIVHGVITIEYKP